MSAETADLVGGGVDGLRGAVEAAREGQDVRFVEPSLRAGAPFLTESFLTPFRFNLSQSLVQRPGVSGLELLEPEPLVAVGSATLGRASITLEPAATASATLEANDLRDRAQRITLLALGLALGIDPDAPGSGGALSNLAAGLHDLVVVAGGNGLVGAALSDELVAAGGHLVEGAGPPVTCESFDGLGLCRLFVGLRHTWPAAPAFLEAYGFDDESSLTASLERLGTGDVTQPLGFLVDNSHLDPRGALDERLGSFVWQGILPAGSSVTRSGYTASVLELLGLREHDVVFKLLWFPDETGEPLGALPWARAAPRPRAPS